MLRDAATTLYGLFRTRTQPSDSLAHHTLHLKFITHHTKVHRGIGLSTETYPTQPINITYTTPNTLHYTNNITSLIKLHESRYLLLYH